MEKCLLNVKKNQFLGFFHLKKVLFCVFLFLQFLTLAAQTESLTKQEIRLGKFYFLEDYSRLAKKALSLSKKEKFSNRPLIFFYAAVGNFNSDFNLQSKKFPRNNLLKWKSPS